MSHSLTDIIKALHIAKENAIVDITNGEVVAVYPKTNILLTQSQAVELQMRDAHRVFLGVNEEDRKTANECDKFELGIVK